MTRRFNPLRAAARMAAITRNFDATQKNGAAGVQPDDATLEASSGDTSYDHDSDGSDIVLVAMTKAEVLEYTEAQLERRLRELRGGAA